jgi:hypothetical protein
MPVIAANMVHCLLVTVASWLALAIFRFMRQTAASSAVPGSGYSHPLSPLYAAQINKAFPTYRWKRLYLHGKRMTAVELEVAR